MKHFETFTNVFGWTLEDMIIHFLQSGREGQFDYQQGCISCGMCSYPELTKDHVLTSAYVYIFRTVTRNAVNKSV